MLFNSFEFLYLFLPLVLGVYIIFERLNFKREAIIGLLIAASVIFYASWNFSYLPLVLISVLLNYLTGQLLLSQKNRKLKLVVLYIGIILNLLLLYFYKYFPFTLHVMGFDFLRAESSNIFLASYLLPLGISFWTFQQINFIIEKYNGINYDESFFEYSAVVLFFPHLIAGPIVRISELLPQFKNNSSKRNLANDFSVGIFIFLIGLGKKVLIADNIANLTTPYFSSVDLIDSSKGGVAWFMSTAFMLQLYFDFSGYCDMGMGLARLFGFNFPINFNSPLKARSFVDFWRRWHITLTRFFTDTIHTPLALSLMRSKGESKFAYFYTVFLPVSVTFFLTGIWHGAGGQFVIFGILNGFFMALGIYMQNKKIKIKNVYLSTALTFMLVSTVFVYFKSDSIRIANHVVYHLYDLKSINFWFEPLINLVGNNFISFLAYLIGLSIAFISPNLYDLIQNIHVPLLYKPNALEREINLDNAYVIAGAMIIFAISVFFILTNGDAPFLYFQF